MTQDAFELMRELGHGQYMAVGHDKGAPTARRLAAENPDRVRGVVIIDAAPEGGNRPQRQDPTGRQWYFDFFRQRGVAEQLIGQNPALFFSLFLDRNPHLTPEEHDYYVAMFSRPGVVDAILADYRSSLERDRGYWAERLAAHGKMTTPVCAIWSSRGPEGDASMLEQWREAAEDVRGSPIADHCALRTGAAARRHGRSHSPVRRRTGDSLDEASVGHEDNDGHETTRTIKR